MDEILFLGRDDKIDSVQRRVMKTPFYVGAIIILIFTIYEIFKLYLFGNSTAVIYVNYFAENIFRSVTSIIGLTVILLITSLVIAGIIRMTRTSTSSSHVYLAIIFCSAGALIVSALFAILRFIIDVQVLRSSTLPIWNIWLYRFMNGTTVIAELSTAFDLLLNGALIMAIILVMISMVDLFTEIDLHIDITKNGKDIGNETTKWRGKSIKLDCKMKNGIKACHIA